MMIMEGSVGLLSGVEMNRIRQKGVLARYPFYWHLAGNVGGQYIKDSSIVRSFNRCITVHGSHNASIENNVCMHHVGHGFFLEDGVETGNVFDGNLGLLTRKPADDVALVPSDIQAGDGSGRQRSAIGIYDYGGVLEDVHFLNYNNDYGPSYVFAARDAAVRHTGSRVKGATFENGFLLYDLRKPIDEVEPSQWGAVIHDMDGSFGFAPNSALVSNHSMMTDSTCSFDIFGEGCLCQNHYGYLSMGFPIRENLPPLVHSRSDGIEVSFQPLAPRACYQSVVSVNHNRYYYGYKFDQTPVETSSLRVIMRFLHDSDTTVLRFHDLQADTVIGSEAYVVASSIADLRAGAGDRYFHDGQSLYVKMQAEGDEWDAGDRLDLSW